LRIKYNLNSLERTKALSSSNLLSAGVISVSQDRRLIPL
jgi:hypothetical protein